MAEEKETKAQRAKRISAEFDALIEEMGPPAPVITSGPSEADPADVLAPGDQDVTHEAFGLSVEGDDSIRTKRGAIEWGRDVMRQRLAIFRGLCLMFVRMCFNADALLPDARAAWFDAGAKHQFPCKPSEAPRGFPGFFRGGLHWHTVLLLGNGRCLTNDTGEEGTINVALIEDIEKAWGYLFLGYTDLINGEAVPAPRPTPRRSNRAFKIAVLRRLKQSARDAGLATREARFAAWLDKIRSRR